MVTSPATRSAVDHTVVSVGPYMLCSSAGVISPSLRARSPVSASPPTKSTFNDPKASAASGAPASSPASVGVHCMCDTPCARISDARSASRLAPVKARRTVSMCGRDARTSSVPTPKSIRQAISSTPSSASRSANRTHCSGVPNRPPECMYRSAACSSSASRSSSPSVSRSRPICLARPRNKSSDVLRYWVNGPRATLSARSPSGSMNVCSINATCPPPVPWRSRQAAR